MSRTRALLVRCGRLWRLLRANNEPIVLFNWTPNFIEAMYDGKFIEFPTFADECRTDASWGMNPETTHDCGNPKDGYLKLGVWSGGLPGEVAELPTRRFRT